MEENELDQIKIGRFIAEMRKKQTMTQKQLAEKLGISDKAVSKWECGKSMPDNSILLELCKILEINVNELLSGELLSTENYHGKAEENMMNLIHETEKSKQQSTFVPMLLSLATLIVVLCTAFLSVNGSMFWFMDSLSFIIIAGITMAILIASSCVKDFFHSFGICYRKKTLATATPDEIRQAWIAFRLALISVLLSGTLFSVMQVIIILQTYFSDNVSDILLMPAFAVSFLSLLYSLIIDLFLLPTGVRLKKLLLSKTME